MSNLTLGNQGENLATTHLQQKKYQILARNLRTKLGEIDILARDGQFLVLVEVKTKTSARLGSALEMITRAKQQKLLLLALELQKKYQTEKVRIDVVAIDNAKAAPQLKHHKGIVEASL